MASSAFAARLVPEFPSCPVHILQTALVKNYCVLCALLPRASDAFPLPPTQFSTAFLNLPLQVFQFVTHTEAAAAKGSFKLRIQFTKCRSLSLSAYPDSHRTRVRSSTYVTCAYCYKRLHDQHALLASSSAWNACVLEVRGWGWLFSSRGRPVNARYEAI